MISTFIFQTLFFYFLYLPGKIIIDLINKYTRTEFDKKNSFFCIIFTLFFLGNFLVIINYFFPLNLEIQFIIFILLIVSSFYKFNYKDINLFYITLISLFILPVSILSEPGHDGGLYHIPYQTWIKNNELTIGLFNLHSRYALTTFHDYLSAGFTINNIFTLNSYFQTSLFLLFFLFFINLYKKNNLIFIVVSSSLLSFVIWHRYVQIDYGSVDLFFGLFAIFTIIKFIEITLDVKKIGSQDILELLLFISITLMSKSTGIFFILLLPILFLIYPNIKKFKYIKNLNFFYLIFIFLVVWFIKNLMISGCFVYPVKFTCFNLDWFNQNYINRDVLLIQKYNENFKTLNFENIFKIINLNYIFILVLTTPLILYFFYKLLNLRKLPFLLLGIFSLLLIFSVSNESLKGFSNLSNLSNLSGDYVSRDKIILNEILRILISSISSIVISLSLICILYKQKLISIFQLHKERLLIFGFSIILFFIWFLNSPDPRLGFWLFAILPTTFCFLIVKNSILIKSNLLSKFPSFLVLIFFPLVFFSYFHFKELQKFKNYKFFKFENKIISNNTITEKRKFFGVKPIVNDNKPFNPSWNHCWNIIDCYYNEDEADIKNFLIFKYVFIK